MLSIGDGMDKKKITNMEVKKTNRNRIYCYIRGHGSVSNPDIAYDLKISLPTVTQMTKELIEKGWVEEKGEFQSTGGRRAKALSAAVNAGQAVGLDITKNHVGLVFTNLSGEILSYERIYLPFVWEDAYFLQVNEKLEAFLDGLETDGADRKKLLGLGIAFPGIVDTEREMIVYSHILGVESAPFSSISRFFSYPCFFMNDANAGAYAEGIHAGVYTEEQDRFFYLSLSNTVGGAVFGNNRLEQGKNFRCGEAGHMTVVVDGKPCYCGKKGCLDAYCAASRLSDAAEGKLEKFFLALDEGEEKAAALWDEYTTYLAVALNNIHMLLDCDIILGGYVGSYAGAHIQDIWDKVSARDTFEEKKPFVKACRHTMGAAALGAALKVIEDFVQQI